MWPPKPLNKKPDNEQGCRCKQSQQYPQKLLLAAGLGAFLALALFLGIMQSTQQTFLDEDLLGNFYDGQPQAFIDDSWVWHCSELSDRCGLEDPLAHARRDSVRPRRDGLYGSCFWSEYRLGSFRQWRLPRKTQV